MNKFKLKKASRKLTKLKHTVNFLSHSPDSKITRAILAASLDGVIRPNAIAVLNVHYTQQ